MKRLPATIAALLLSICCHAADAPSPLPRPPFHHLATIDGRDTIVAPDGTAFFAAGVCHVHPRGSHSHALGYSPYKRFVEASYPSLDAWAEETASRLRDWGFTSLGAACDTTLMGGRGFPNASSSALRMGQDFATDEPEHSIRPFKGAPCTALPNVFHPDFPGHCEKIAAGRCAAAKDDPDLLGWYIDNELAWWSLNGQRATGVYDAIADMPPEHSARKALDAFLEEWAEAHRPDNAGAEAPSFEAKVAFLHHFARTYFAITTAAIRRHDPNHMILGCRFAGLNGAHPAVWKEAGRFCDIVSFNCYPWADLDHNVVLDEKCGVPMAERFREYGSYAGRPLLVSEWSFPALDTGRPCLKGAGQRVPTQRERAAAAALFLRTMLAQPNVVGCDWFMWCDRPAQGGHKANAEDCNYGLVNEQGEPYGELLAAIAPLLRDATALRGAAIMPALRRQAGGGGPSERDRYFAEAAASDCDSRIVHYDLSPDGAWLLSNDFARVSGHVGLRDMADEIAFGGETVGRFGAMLQVTTCGTNAWIDTTRTTDVSLSGDDATGIVNATIRAENLAGGATTPHFAFTTRLSLAPMSGEILAEIVSIENLGDEPLQDFLPFLRPWALADKPSPVPKVLDCWGAPCEAEWRLPDGGSWGASSHDDAARRFRFFVDSKGRQHPDLRFAPVDQLGQTDLRPILPGETWIPPSPMSARIRRK